jgi:hypothetical protein
MVFVTPRPRFASPAGSATHCGLAADESERGAKNSGRRLEWEAEALDERSEVAHREERLSNWRSPDG